MGLRHNKKRNSGLLREFFAKHIAKNVVAKNYNHIDLAKKVWGSYLKEGTELSKEMKLFNALVDSDFSNKETAYEFLKQVKESAARIDVEQLNKEKTSLIREINNTFENPDFFNQSITEFTNYATIQLLLDTWENRSLQESIINPAMAELEDKALNYLCDKSRWQNSLNEDVEQILAMKDEDVDCMVVNIMTEKLNAKFDNLNESQKDVLRKFAFGNCADELQETVEKVRTETLNLINTELNKKETGKAQKDKLEEIKSLLENDYAQLDEMTDDNIAFYMSVCQLNEELKDE